MNPIAVNPADDDVHESATTWSSFERAIRLLSCSARKVSARFGPLAVSALSPQDAPLRSETL